MGDRRRETLWRIALVAWVVFIWAHSLLPGDASGSESGFFLTLLRPVLELFGMRDLDAMHFIVRKLAHFSEYAVLGMLATRVLAPTPSRGDRRTWAFCAIWALVPALDETIQMFTPDRGPAVTDVLIDMSGFATGLAVVTCVRALLRARHPSDEG